LSLKDIYPYNKYWRSGMVGGKDGEREELKKSISG
jgi:hypothetical protein